MGNGTSWTSQEYLYRLKNKTEDNNIKNRNYNIENDNRIFQDTTKLRFEH